MALDFSLSASADLQRSAWNSHIFFLQANSSLCVRIRLTKFFANSCDVPVGLALRAAVRNYFPPFIASATSSDSRNKPDPLFQRSVFVLG